MDTMMRIDFKVTASQKDTIDLRVKENGFTDISEYLRVTALKTESVNVTPAGATSEEPTIEVGFDVNEVQKQKLEEKSKESGAESLDEYLLYIALHAVVNSVIEIRSTGNLDAMLARIQAMKK
jgi:hypothetical protein